MNRIKLIFLGILFLSSISHASQQSDSNVAARRGLFKIGFTNNYEGLTEKGLKFLKLQRDLLRAANKDLNGKLLNARSAVHAAFVSRMLQGHVFIYGPPGAAKSVLSREFFGYESGQPFQIQLHQAMTEQALIGGQDFEAAKRGEYQVNTEGTLATFKTAILDEIDKANPGVLSVLLGLMQEREVQVGKVVVKAVLQSIFATSNAILPEILDSFRESGQLSTAAALLNRFQFKVCLYNWLDADDQETLSQKKFERMWQDALRFERNEPEIRVEKSDGPRVDWEALRAFARYSFRFSNKALKAFTFLVDKMREGTNNEIKASRARHMEDPDSEPFVYFPSADHSERLRQIIPETVMYSAFVDFLLSPLADDAVLDSGFLNEPVELKPSSIWRSYLILTTIFSGHTTLKNANGKFEIQFSNKVDKTKLRDDREKALLKMIEKEQERFQTQYAKIANFECLTCPSTNWLDDSAHKDIEELLQPNKDSDRIRRDAKKTEEQRIEQERLEKERLAKEAADREKAKNTLPSGSYRSSCVDCEMKQGTLRCRCTYGHYSDGDPKRAWSSLENAHLCNSGIENNRGDLKCPGSR